MKNYELATLMGVIRNFRVSDFIYMLNKPFFIRNCILRNSDWVLTIIFKTAKKPIWTGFTKMFIKNLLKFEIKNTC